MQSGRMSRSEVKDGSRTESRRPAGMETYAESKVLDEEE